MARKIEVEIVGDSRSLERAFARSERSAKKFQTSMGRISGRGRGGGIRGGMGAIGFTPQQLGLGALAVGLKQSVDAASDFNEQISKSAIVFGDSAQSIEDWSKTTTTAFGISERQAIATASSFGALFAPIGIVGAESAKQSQKLTELGADLAAFYNTDVQDALDAIRSGLVGESEPLRRYGVRLSEVRVQQQAMVDTGKDNVKQLTEQDKSLARIKIILQDSAKAQGNFGDTSEGMAGQVKIAQANIDDLKVAIGTGLIPVLTTAISAVNDFYGALRGTADKHKTLKNVIVTSLLIGSGVGAPIAIGRLVQQYRKAGKKTGESFMEGLGTAIKTQFGDIAKSLPHKSTLAEILRGPDLLRAGRRQVGPTAEQRRGWFDARIARQLDRVQDLALRKQAARLKFIAAEIRAQIGLTQDKTRRLALEDELLDVTREQKSVQDQITESIKAGNQALKDRADAIKSAIIERLQRRQADIVNKRALQDAKETLRLALALGGPKGIRLARRGVADVRTDMRIAALERAPATLTKGGRFALGNIVTININGVTDPEAVANRVATVLKRRQKHGTSLKSGPHAGAVAG